MALEPLGRAIVQKVGLELSNGPSDFWSCKGEGDAEGHRAATIVWLKNRRLRATLSLSVVSLRSLLWALVSPSTHATVGLVSGPSGDVSDLLLVSV